MDSHNLEPQELNDRIKLYSHKLSQQWSTIQEDSGNVSNGKRKLCQNNNTIRQGFKLSKYCIILFHCFRSRSNYRAVKRYSKCRS